MENLVPLFLDDINSQTWHEYRNLKAADSFITVPVLDSHGFSLLEKKITSRRKITSRFKESKWIKKSDQVIHVLYENWDKLINNDMLKKNPSLSGDYLSFINDKEYIFNKVIHPFTTCLTVRFNPYSLVHADSKIGFSRWTRLKPYSRVYIADEFGICFIDLLGFMLCSAFFSTVAFYSTDNPFSLIFCSLVKQIFQKNGLSVLDLFFPFTADEKDNSIIKTSSDKVIKITDHDNTFSSGTGVIIADSFSLDSLLSIRDNLDQPFSIFQNRISGIILCTENQDETDKITKIIKKNLSETDIIVTHKPYRLENILSGSKLLSIDIIYISGNRDFALDIIEKVTCKRIESGKGLSHFAGRKLIERTFDNYAVRISDILCTRTDIDFKG